MRKGLWKSLLCGGLCAALLGAAALPAAAAGTELTQRSDFIWGGNGHNKGYVAYPESQVEKQIKVAAELGVGIYRFNYNPATLDEIEYLDYVVKLCKAYGLKMMLVMDNSGPAPNSDGYQSSKEASYISALADRGRMIAARYAGKIDYIQIFNEVDIPCLVNGQGGDGSNVNQFNQTWLAIYAKRFKAVNDAIKAENKSVKTVVNISYKHTGLFDYLADYQGGVNFDVIGLDWYSNMGSMTDMLTYLTRYKQKEIIVCETNIWDGTEGKYEAERTAYLTKVMKEAYYHPSKRVKGLIFYELLDERNLVEHENEAWFGLVNCDINGNIGAVKPAYKEIQKLLGGKAMDTIHVDRDSPWDDIDSPTDPTVKPTTKPPAVKTTPKATGKPTSQPNTTTVTDAVSSGSGETTGTATAEDSTTTGAASAATTAATSTEPQSGVPVWPFVVGGIVLVLGGGGFAAWWFLLRGKKAS